MVRRRCVCRRARPVTHCVPHRRSGLCRKGQKTLRRGHRHEDKAFDLVAALSAPEANGTWAKRVGVIPVHKGADQDPYFQTEQFEGWFKELNGAQYEPTTMVPGSDLSAARSHSPRLGSNGKLQNRRAGSQSSVVHSSATG